MDYEKQGLCYIGTIVWLFVLFLAMAGYFNKWAGM